MNAPRMLVRWGKFNAVGGMGVVVQLAALAAINRMWAGHYLLATAAAIELTLLHNFAWHVRWTWRDRRGGSDVGAACARFHVSNGLVSMVGNLALMRVLVDGAHAPVLMANCVAIVCCSIVNFFLGDLWAFAPRDGAVSI
ncbi:MAG TPA: GtrA family protein [Terracidiphilus sp.]|jgi:putative flippase GtrA